jgi:hypothetical protein
MQESKQFNNKMKQVLMEKADKVEVSPGLFNKVRTEIENDNFGRSHIMKKNILKKAAVLAAVICLGSVSVFAAGKVSSYVSAGGTTSKEYPTENNLEKELGYPVKIVKDFSNGYSFHSYDTTEVSAKDKDGNEVGKYKVVDMNYIKDKSDVKEPVTLVISKPTVEDNDNNPGTTITKNNMEFTYKESTVKFVPEDYQLTKEDKEKKAAGEIEISYGSPSDDVRIVKFQFMNWQDNGVKYSIMASDQDFSKEELLQMAAEVIQ